MINITKTRFESSRNGSGVWTGLEWTGVEWTRITIHNMQERREQNRTEQNGREGKRREQNRTVFERIKTNNSEYSIYLI